MKKYYLFICVIALIISSCAFDSDGSSGDSSTGDNSSTARFNIYKEKLYTVDNQNIHTFDISNPTEVKYESITKVGWDIETIFAYNNNLFLGARHGMYIFPLDEEGMPTSSVYTSHFDGRDPVVAQGDYAYVTVAYTNSGELFVYSVKDISNPVLLYNYQMTNPMGLSVDNNLLFVCDEGVKIFKIGDNSELEEIFYLNEERLLAYDLIAKDGILYVIAKNGLHQYQYSFDEENSDLEITKLGDKPIEYNNDSE